MIVYVVAFFASAAIVFLPYFIHDKIQRKQIQLDQPMAQMTAQMDQQINSLRAQNSESQRQMIQDLRAAAVMSLLPMPGYMGYSPHYQLTQCCVQYPTQYPNHLYGGWMFRGCCCDFME